MYGDPLLTAFVCVRSNGGAQALAVSAAVTVASVCEAVPVEPGHIHLDSTHAVRKNTHRLRPSLSEPGQISHGANGAGGVLLRGRVVFNNSSRKKVSDETWGQKNVGQPLVEGGSDELRDGQEEAQPGEMHQT